MKTILVYCWESTSEPMTIQAMKDAGYYVVTFSQKLKDYHADAAFARSFIEILHSTKADMVFSYDYFPLVSMICEINCIPYASWVYDCPQYGLLSKTLTNSCNQIFCFDKAYTARLQKTGSAHIHHFPLAGDLEMYEMAKQDKDRSAYACDISFVGGLYNGEKNRLLTTRLSEYAEGYVEGLLRSQKQICGYNLIADALPVEIAEEIESKCELALSDAYSFDTIQMAADAINMKLTAQDREEVLGQLSRHFDVVLYSNSQLPESLTGNEHLVCKGTVDYHTGMPLVFQNSKINLNMTSRTIESGVPQRVFDILACGGFCLTNYQPEIAALFEDGKELVMYTDIDDMLMKADYYLSHEKERMQIARAGYEKVRNGFSIKDRIVELIHLV